MELAEKDAVKHIGLVTNYQELLKKEPTEHVVILEFIAQRNLPIFVDKQGTVFYKKTLHGGDQSYKRSLTELVSLVYECTHEKVISRPVEEAVFESFLENASLQKAVTKISVEDNQKVEDILNAMIEMNASDLHIKLQQHSDVTAIRMRINGELVHYGTLSYQVGDALLRSLWINYSGTDRAEHSINNGSFYFRPKRHKGREFMVRMTESPEVRGMMFVARIRDPNEIRELEDIGYTEQQMTVIKNLLGHRKGMASINGPTNSGKSSTQSTMLAMMPKSCHIVEIGDPVETYQDHIAHLELRDSYPGGKDKHLEHLLGATVRQDPDILALTEMRDSLTARAALQLASQGKFVITTMHTTDFVSCFERFQRMGLTKEDLVAPGFLRGLVCQKLMPKLCGCSTTQAPSQEVGDYYSWLMGGGGIRYRNHDGCSKCKNTGIISRVLVAEAVEITNSMLKIIRSILFDSNPEPFYEYAKENGIINIHQHARQRVKAGEVDPRTAETEVGRFSKDNLLWLYPAEVRN